MAETWVSMPELKELLGRDKAALLCRMKGGVPFYVPAKVDGKHQLAGILGEFGMGLLCGEFSGMYITVPTGKLLEPRKPDVLRLLREGRSHSSIAVALGVTERYVRMVAAQPAPQTIQLTFFS